MERKDAGVSSGLKAKASKNKDAHTHTHKHRRAPQLSRWRRRRYRCGCKAEGKQPSAAAAYEAKQRQVEPRPPAAVLNPGILTGGSASEFLPKTAFKPHHPDINTHPDCLATGSAGGRDGGGASSRTKATHFVLNGELPLTSSPMKPLNVRLRRRASAPSRPLGSATLAAALLRQSILEEGRFTAALDGFHFPD